MKEFSSILSALSDAEEKAGMVPVKLFPGKYSVSSLLFGPNKKSGNDPVNPFDAISRSPGLVC